MWGCLKDKSLGAPIFYYAKFPDSPDFYEIPTGFWTDSREGKARMGIKQLATAEIWGKSAPTAQLSKHGIDRILFISC